MKKICPICSKGVLNYNLYGYPDIGSVDIIKERFDITTNIKGCEPPLAGKKITYIVVIVANIKQEI